MSVTIPVRPETKRRLEDVRIQLITQLKTSKVTWDMTLNTLMESWSQSKAPTEIPTKARRRKA